MAQPQITLQVLKVLDAMLEDPKAEHYGLEIGARTNLKGGTLYPILARIEGAKWVTSRWEDIDPSEAGRPRRRLYKLTGIGAEVATQQLQEAPARRPHGTGLPGFVAGRLLPGLGR